MVSTQSIPMGNRGLQLQKYYFTFKYSTASRTARERAKQPNAI